MSNKTPKIDPSLTKNDINQIEQFVNRKDLTADDIQQLVKYRDQLDNVIANIKSKGGSNES